MSASEWWQAIINGLVLSNTYLLFRLINQARENARKK